MLIGAVPAVAGAACPSATTSTPFASLGDLSLYSLLSGSSFESGATGWLLNNAEVVTGASVAGGTHALEIEPRGTATSPTFCINGEDPTFRFYARQTGGGRSSLAVTIVWRDIIGIRHYTPVGSVPGSSSWAATQTLPLATKLPLWMPGSTLNAQLQFQPEGSGTWAIDDVYIDPHSR